MIRYEIRKIKNGFILKWNFSPYYTSDELVPIEEYFESVEKIAEKMKDILLVNSDKLI